MRAIVSCTLAALTGIIGACDRGEPAQRPAEVIVTISVQKPVAGGGDVRACLGISGTAFEDIGSQPGPYGFWSGNRTMDEKPIQTIGLFENSNRNNVILEGVLRQEGHTALLHITSRIAFSLAPDPSSIAKVVMRIDGRECEKKLSLPSGEHEIHVSW